MVNTTKFQFLLADSECLFWTVNSVAFTPHTKCTLSTELQFTVKFIISGVTVSVYSV